MTTKAQAAKFGTTVEVQERRIAAAQATNDRFHAAFHQVKGATAPCERCGTK
jgi:hypothetical protein